MLGPTLRLAAAACLFAAALAANPAAGLAAVPDWVRSFWLEQVEPRLPSKPALTLLEQDDPARYWTRVAIIVVGYMGEGGRRGRAGD